jgi:hypothetical protein
MTARSPRPAREIYLEISVRLRASRTSLVSDLKETQARQPSFYDRQVRVNAKLLLAGVVFGDRA